MTATWPVTVRFGERFLRLRTLNLSALGAKVGLPALARPAHPPAHQEELLPVGSPASLRLEPPGHPAVEVEAIVWRADDDGSAFLFVGRSHAG